MPTRTALLVGLLTCSPLLAPAAQAQGGVSSFCQSGVAGATIYATGSTNFDANDGSGDLVLHANGLPSGAAGIFFYGSQTQAPAPMGNGYLCVSGPIWRLEVLTTEPGSDSVSSPLDYLSPPHPAARITPGSTWNFQYWFRSAGASDTTDGLTVSFALPVPLTSVTTLAYYTKTGHPFGQIHTGGVVVINSTTEMRDFWRKHTRGLFGTHPAPQVNLDTHTVIAVFLGRRFELGYSISVADIALSVTTLQVLSEESTPCGGGSVYTEVRPFIMVTVDKIDGATLGRWDTTTLDCP